VILRPAQGSDQRPIRRPGSRRAAGAPGGQELERTSAPHRLLKITRRLVGPGSQPSASARALEKRPRQIAVSGQREDPLESRGERPSIPSKRPSGTLIRATRPEGAHRRRGIKKYPTGRPARASPEACRVADPAAAFAKRSPAVRNAIEIGRANLADWQTEHARPLAIGRASPRAFELVRNAFHMPIKPRAAARSGRARRRAVSSRAARRARAPSVFFALEPVRASLSVLHVEPNPCARRRLRPRSRRKSLNQFR